MRQVSEYPPDPGRIVGVCPPRSHGPGGIAMLSHSGRRMEAVTLITVLVMASSPTLVRGQATAPAIGTRVVLRPGAVLMVGDRVVDAGGANHLYAVERANGDWPWLTSGATPG